jgi:aspartate/methionine/tyrosine aminotransferase
MVEEFLARRDLIVDGLNAIPGFECLRPQGAFYVFPRISGTGLDGPALADRLLQEAGVSVLSGTAFGGFGRDHIRVSYANSRANLAEGLRRIRSVVDRMAIEGVLPEAAMAASAGAAQNPGAAPPAGAAPSAGS